MRLESIFQKGLNIPPLCSPFVAISPGLLRNSPFRNAADSDAPGGLGVASADVEGGGSAFEQVP